MTERKKVSGLILLIGIILSFFAALSEGDGYGGGDSIQHFLISKYSFVHPELFLHHWGKPFFILISSPFAQFGFIGINIFNISCVCFTCWLAYDLTVRWQIPNGWMVIFILLFSPIYFACIISGLTEVFFAMVLMLAIWLFQREKLFVSSIVISFLPFVRTEGILILPLFAVLLLLRKKFIAIAALMTGILLYSIIGGFYYNDFLWVLHQNPYDRVNDIYGRGSLAFFLGRNEYILGAPIVIFFLLGVTALLLKKQKASSTELVLALGSFALYFIAHSIFWWKGMFGSAGLVRVMGAITPVVAFTGLRGFNFLSALFSRWNIAGKLVLSVLILYMVWLPFKQHPYPRKPDFEAVTIKPAGQWILNNHLKDQKIFCATPYMWVILNTDPFDRAKASDFYLLDKEFPEKNIEPGTLIIWDSHFSPNEGGISLDKLRQSASFRLLSNFETDPLLVPKVKGKYEIYIFQRI